MPIRDGKMSDSQKKVWDRSSLYSVYSTMKTGRATTTMKPANHWNSSQKILPVTSALTSSKMNPAIQSTCPNTYHANASAPCAVLRVQVNTRTPMDSASETK